jgi:hypothetical protein
VNELDAAKLNAFGFEWELFCTLAYCVMLDTGPDAYNVALLRGNNPGLVGVKRIVILHMCGIYEFMHDHSDSVESPTSHPRMRSSVSLLNS